MSLNYDYSKCNLGNMKLDASGVPCGVSQDIIFATMSLDLGHISEKNLQEWAFRMNVGKQIGYTFLFNFDDLKKHIGLSTNVCTKPRAKWLKRIMENIRSDAEYAIRDLV